MIRGRVNAQREATVTLRVRGPAGAEADVDAVIDSGFSASLTLPTAVVTALALVQQSRGRVFLADGSAVDIDHFEAEVDWDGVWRSVLVTAVGDEVLMGMRMLAGHELRVAVVPGGTVEITPLP